MPHPHGQAGAERQAGSTQLGSNSPQRMGEPNLAGAGIPRRPPGGAEGTAVDSHAAGGDVNMPV